MMREATIKLGSQSREVRVTPAAPPNPVGRRSQKPMRLQGWGRDGREPPGARAADTEAKARERVGCCVG